MTANGPRPPSDVFEYDPLSSPTSIRLLRVLPLQEGELISVELWEQAQTVPLSYRCLSYTWGDLSTTTTIQVNGRVMHVGANLRAFLVVAAQRFPNETLWIDAISINQSDNTEKGHQVQRMGEVYKGATEVLVWLGNDEGIARLFDWTREHSTTWHKLCYYLPSERVPKHLRHACHRLVSNSYWSRAWIVQELAFGNSIRFLCDLSESSPDSLKRCESGALNRVVPLNSLFAPIDLIAFLIDEVIVGSPAMKPVLDFLETTEKANPRYQMLSAFERRRDIWAFKFEDKECRDPRDRIYSLLSIANVSDFEVSYTESNFNTFWRAAEYFDAWPDPTRLISLWKALELRGVDFLAAENAGSLQCSVTTRPSSLFGISCKHAQGRDRFVGRKSPVAKGDILLCPGQTNTMHWSSPHFVVRSDSEDGFIVAMYLERSRACRAICIEDAELWYKAIGQETRILGWKEFVRVVKAEDSHDGTGEFVVKLPPFYLLATLGLWYSGHNVTKNVLKDFDITLDHVDVKFLP